MFKIYFYKGQWYKRIKLYQLSQIHLILINLIPCVMINSKSYIMEYLLKSSTRLDY